MGDLGIEPRSPKTQAGALPTRLHSHSDGELCSSLADKLESARPFTKGILSRPTKNVSEGLNGVLDSEI